MTPFEAIDKLVPNVIPGNNKLPKFQMGYYVRVPDKRNIFSKSHRTTWNRVLFKIHKTNASNPVTYSLEDENSKLLD